jgi:general secretion pathway protein D
MKRPLALLLTFIFAITWNGCSSDQTALEQLQKTYHEPIDAMRLPEQPQPRGERIIELSEPQGEVEPGLDISLPESDIKYAVEKLIVVTEEKVPLYKGPGSQFKRLAFAYLNQKFKWLRTVKENEFDGTWHLVKDRNNQNFFISTESSRIIEKKLAPSRKVVLKSKDSVETVPSKGIFDPTPPLPPELVQAKHLTLNFEQTNIYEVITTFCELLKINYIIEGKVDGKITLQTFRKVPTRDLYSVFEQILAVNGITVVKSGNFYRFLPIRDSSKKPLNLLYGNKSQITDKDRVVIQLIPLKNLPPATIKKTIAPLITQNGVLLDVPETNILMLIDLASSVKQITQVVEALDTDKVASSDIQLYTIKHSDPEIVAEELKVVFGSIGYTSSMDKSLMFIPLARINSILVVSALEDVIQRVDFWIEKLDQPISAGQLSTFVYYIQNAEAEKLAGVLNTIFGEKGQKNILGGTPKTKPANSKDKNSSKSPLSNLSAKKTSLKVQGGIESSPIGEIHIIPDVDTNSLIIRTEAKNYPTVQEIIKKLDLLPQQVLIEVLILDLVIDEETRTGIEWALKGTVGNRGIDGGDRILGGGGTGSSSTLGAEIANTATSLFAPGASFFVQQKDRFIGLLQAFASDAKVKIVSNPILITSDNKEANISIADDIPISSASISTPTAGQPLTQSSIQFRSVGIKLGILPKINSENYVNLKIDQEVSNLGPEFATGVSGDRVTTTPSFTTRTIKTEVVLKDNQVLVMGGLMRTTENETISGIPLLMNIPYLGRLFSSHSNTINQTELMLFITPHIISNTNDSNFVTEQFKNKLGIFLDKPTTTTEN